MGIEISGLQSGSFAGAAAEQAARPERGVFMGAEVRQADSPASLLADAAEELTFSMSETQESKLDERKEKAGSDKNRAQALFIAAVREVLQGAGDKVKNAVSNLERMCNSRNHMELSELLRELGNELKGGGESSNKPDLAAPPDPADQFTVLYALKEKLGPGHPLAGVVDAALDHLAETEAPAISSGLSAQRAAQGFSDLDGSSSLRSFYRDAVEDFASPREALTRILAQYGQGRLEQALDFLMQALGNDISSARPSTETEKLKALTSDITAVRVLGMAYKCSADMLGRLESAQGAKSRVTAEKLLDLIVSLKDNKYAAVSDVQGIVKALGLVDTEREVLFLQDFARGLRGLPDLFYTEADARLRTLDVTQETLDQTISREESELGF
jgi:type III secretion protein W